MKSTTRYLPEMYLACFETTWKWENNDRILKCSYKKDFWRNNNTYPRCNAIFLTDINICQYPVNELAQYLTWFLHSLVVLNWTGTGKDIKGFMWALFLNIYVEDTCPEYLTREYLSPLAASDVTWLVLAVQESLLTSLVLAPSLLAECAFIIYKEMFRPSWPNKIFSQTFCLALTSSAFTKASLSKLFSHVSSSTANKLGHFVCRLCSREHYVDT